MVSALVRFGPISIGALENDGVWYQDRVGLWYKCTGVEKGNIYLSMDG